MKLTAAPIGPRAVVQLELTRARRSRLQPPLSSLQPRLPLWRHSCISAADLCGPISRQTFATPAAPPSRTKTTNRNGPGMEPTVQRPEPDQRLRPRTRRPAPRRPCSADRRSPRPRLGEPVEAGRAGGLIQTPGGRAPRCNRSSKEPSAACIAARVRNVITGCPGATGGLPVCQQCPTAVTHEHCIASRPPAWLSRQPRRCVARGSCFCLPPMGGPDHRRRRRSAAVACLGHGRSPRASPPWRRSGSRSVAYAHTGLFTTEAAEELADHAVSARDRSPEAPASAYAFFVSSGSEAMATESALKLARQYFLEIGAAGSVTRFIARRVKAIMATHWARWPPAATSGAPRAVRGDPGGRRSSHVSPCFAYRGQRRARGRRRLCDPACRPSWTRRSSGPDPAERRGLRGRDGGGRRHAGLRGRRAGLFLGHAGGVRPARRAVDPG